MRFLATYIMRGRVQAVLATVLCAVLATVLLPLLLLLPLSVPLSWMSAAAVGLVTLTHGPFEGLLTALGAAILLGLLGLVSAGDPQLAFGFVVMIWLPVWLTAYFVRQTGSIAVGLLTAAGLGALVVVGAYAVLGDPAQAWRAYVEHVLLPALQQAGPGGAANQQEVRSFLNRFAPYVVGAASAGMTVGWVAPLLLARWWQGQLVSPEGFRRDFYGLRLGQSLSIAALIALAVVAVLPTRMGITGAANLGMVVAVLFGVQGLAIVHALLARRKASVGWLIAMYVLLPFTIPYGVGLLAVTGLVDNWLDFRHHVRTPSQ